MTILGISTIPPTDVIVVAAPYAPAGPIVIGTSLSSNDVGIGGTYVFAMEQVGLGFTSGLRVRASVATDATTWIEGVVSSFDGINLTIVSDLAHGTGVHASWNIGIAGEPGQKGQKGDTGAQGPIGPGGGVPADSPTFTGDPKAPTPVPGDNDNSIATTQFVQTALVNYQRFDPDLSALAALTGTGVIYYRSAADTWSAVTIGTGLTFAAGTLSTAGGLAPIDSPAFTGNPTAPTPAAGDADTSIATTGFVAASFAPLASPILTGAPKAPTAAPGTNNTTIASTAFVQAALAAGYQPLDADLTALAGLTGTNVFFYRSADGVWGPVTIGANLLFSGGTLSATGTTGGGGVPADSPVFTGDPTGPTAPPGDNDSSLATTAFVQGELAAYARLASPSFSGNPQAPTPTAGDNDTSIATTAFVQTAMAGKADTSALTSKADLVSPVFTGNPQAPTPAGGDSDTSIATTAFVQGAIAGKADLNSPVLTGDPKAPTPLAADNDTSIATTAFVKTALGTYAPLDTPTFTGAPAAPTPTPASDNSTRIATTAFVQALLGAAINVPNMATNPAFMIDQFYAGTVATVSAGSGGVWSPIDGFNFQQASDATHTLQRIESVTPGNSPRRLKISVTVADAAIAAAQFSVLQHCVEGLHFTHMRWGTVSARPLLMRLGFKPPIAGTFYVSFQNSAANRSYVHPIVVAAGEVGTDVVRYFTVPGDTSGTWLNDFGTGLRVTFALAAGSTFYAASADTWVATNSYAVAGVTNGIGAVQAWEFFDWGLYDAGSIGSLIPAFVVPRYSEEMARCQRYYEHSFVDGTRWGTLGGAGGSAGSFSWACTTSGIGSMNIYGQVFFKVSKRITPSISCASPVSGSVNYAYDGNYTVDTVITINNAGSGCFTAAPASSPANAQNLKTDWNATARLA